MASGIVESSNQGSSDAAGGAQGAGGPLSRSKLVQRLLAASGNLPAFVNDLLTTQAVVVAGTEAAGFLIEAGGTAADAADDAEPGQTLPATQRPGFSLRAIAHIRPDSSDADARAAAIAAFSEIITPCVQQGRDGTIQIEETGADTEPQFCLVTLLRSEGEVVAVSAVITRCKDIERAQQRLQSMQLVAGYFDLYTLRRTSEQSRQVAQSHQHVLQLATTVATAEGFKAGAMNLCNELATRTGASRVTVGWMKGTTIRVRALSHTEEFDKKQELIVGLERAMEECVDQEEIVQFEPDGTASQNVTREAQALSRAQGGNGVISLPLRRQSEIVGVLTLEFPPGQKLAAQAATGLAVAADLLAPQLYDRFQNDRWWITKTGLSIRDTAALAVGPKHMLAKAIAVLSLGLAVFVCVYRPVYKVSAPFALGPIDKRTITAPMEDAVIKEVTRDARPGTAVKAGTVLVRFEDSDLRDKLSKAMAQRNQFQKEYQKYRADQSKQPEAGIALEQGKQAEADVRLYTGEIDRASVRAPFDCVVLTGDLERKVGARVKLGDVLMEVGDPRKLQVEARVPERDVQDVRVDPKDPQKGWIATSSLPGDKYPFKVTRLVPLNNAKEGAAYFTVYGELEKTNPNWLPGMEGEARIEVGRASLAWIWTHRLVDFVRLKLWM